jgi:hypothetical protein
MGSIISEEHLKRIEEMLASEPKAKILAGGQRLTEESQLDQFDFSKGAFFPPTVVSNVSTQGALWREEIFGPVVVVKQFKVRSLRAWHCFNRHSSLCAGGSRGCLVGERVKIWSWRGCLDSGPLEGTSCSCRD